jgi:ammonium transporter Rh
LGKTNPTQLVVLVFFELIFYNLNLVLCSDWLQITDAGDSITLHLFGACFGLAVSWVVSHKDSVGHTKNSSSRTSDTFAMIGTLFLWMFW